MQPSGFPKCVGGYLLSLWGILTLNFVLPCPLPGDPLYTLLNPENARYWLTTNVFNSRGLACQTQGKAHRAPTRNSLQKLPLWSNTTFSIHQYGLPLKPTTGWMHRCNNNIGIT